VENIRRRLVEQGLEIALNGSQRKTPPRSKVLDGEQEAHIIAMRLGEPPRGYGNEPEQARQLVRRIEFCHTPKHGSWLNIAENELSSLTRQCISHRRFGDIETLRLETSAWSTDVNNTQRGVDWQMQIDDARCKLTSLYPKIKF
jgi:hypothetical protein